MDDLVEKALARWPNVPAIAGWLKLSLQGDWLLTGPVPEGLTISHPRILNFMARNYGCEADGRYYFQNGPQKAYVHLAYTPWVYRIHPLEHGALMLSTHTGLVCWPLGMYQDEQGRVLIEGEHGIGLLHSNDMDLLAEGLHESNSEPGSQCQLGGARSRSRYPDCGPHQTASRQKHVHGATHLHVEIGAHRIKHGGATFSIQPESRS